MTTKTAPHVKDQPNWNSRNKKMQALGLTSMDELRHVERLERGTGQQRQKPRKFDRDDRPAYAAPVGSDKQSFLERLWDFIDREIGRESDFPKDGTHDGQVSRGQQPGHVYAEGDTLSVRIAGETFIKHKLRDRVVLRVIQNDELVLERFEFADDRAGFGEDDDATRVVERVAHRGIRATSQVVRMNGVDTHGQRERGQAVL